MPLELMLKQQLEQEREINDNLKKDLNNANVKILDLENNLELVTNNLSEENKKLIPDFDSQN